jgi:hypothetical protein
MTNTPKPFWTDPPCRLSIHGVHPAGQIEVAHQESKTQARSLIDEDGGRQGFSNCLIV